MALPPTVPTTPTRTILRLPLSAIDVRFKATWSDRGGLDIFGLPIGDPIRENGLLVQYFERERMELHPELVGTRYEVQLAHLGAAALQAAAR